MDKRKLIDLLNEDLETEYRSIVQYVTHAATIKGAELMPVVDEMLKHVGQELEHAITLAQQIDFLGGTPTTSVPSVPVIADDEGRIEADLALEETQLDRYRRRVAEAEEAGLADVAEAIRPILEQTQDHVIDLRDALGHG